MNIAEKSIDLYEVGSTSKMSSLFRKRKEI